jgi:hypothetical protein
MGRSNAQCAYMLLESIPYLYLCLSTDWPLPGLYLFLSRELSLVYLSYYSSVLCSTWAVPVPNLRLVFIWSVTVLYEELAQPTLGFYVLLPGCWTP